MEKHGFRVTTVAVEKQYYRTSVCLFVVLGIRHARRMRHNVICGLPRYTTLFHIIS
jgi:hypothetical protein